MYVEHIYTHKHIHTHIHTHIHIHIHTHTNTHIYLHRHIHMYTHANTRACIHIHPLTLVFLLQCNAEYFVSMHDLTANMLDLIIVGMMDDNKFLLEVFEHVSV